METNHYEKMRQLYDRVIDLPFAHREAQLREWQCEEAIIAAVMGLMIKDEIAFAAQLAAPMQQLLTDHIPALGTELGVWRLMREIGEGGMGQVYLVERCDGHFAQTAALKFLKGLPSNEKLNYFTRERQLLAKLTHPNIARLYDGGATVDGKPYLVMEYVDGLHIDAHCRTHQLRTDAILRLFIEACNGVAFAHRQLIVHCDIKPSNLLINAEGRAILLDFGIARLTDATLPSVVTTTSKVEAYTPRYSSPEQREGGDVSTVSDIYSLGVLLNELLTIASKPSEELSAIIKMATDVDPARRYSSVDALTDDINRYQSRHPVRAMPATRGYLAKKFLHRHWPVVLVGVAFAVTVAGFTTKVVVESQRAMRAEQAALNARDRAQLAESNAVKERDAKEAARTEALTERDRAQSAQRQAFSERDAKEAAHTQALRDRDRARAAEQAAVAERTRATQAELAARKTSDFLVTVFEGAAPDTRTAKIPAARLLDIAEAKLDTEMHGQPATQAEILHTLGVVQRHLVEHERSIALLKRAIAMERNNDRPRLLAKMLFELAASQHVYPRLRPDAEVSSREALALVEKHTTPGSPEIIQSLSQVGNFLTLAGKLSEAAPYHQRAWSLQEKIDANSLAATYVLINRASHERRVGDYAGMDVTSNNVIAIRTRLLGEKHELTMKAREDRAEHLIIAKRYDEGEALLRQSIADRIERQGRQHWIVARQHERLGDLLIMQKRLDEASSTLKTSLDIFSAIDSASAQSARVRTKLVQLISSTESK